jgi:5,6,7,8-tetrahydromethanopterin hydro-lyase
MHSPGLTVKPLTLFVNKAEIRGDTHARLTWGAAQAGVAQGVITAVREGSVSAGELDDLLLIAAVWVDWNAADEDAVYENNLESTRLALEAGARSLPSAEDVLAAEEPWSTFFRPRS